jgi:hypothetical protein
MSTYRPGPRRRARHQLLVGRHVRPRGCGSRRLSGLHFCDVRSTCHILIFTSGMHRNGENVVVHGASRMVLKMINLLGVEDQPELAR